MHDKNTQLRAKELGVKSVPAVAINDVLADCCRGQGVDAEILKAGGLGTPL